MVVLRLRREGGKNRPVFRVVAADSRCARDGRFLELLGVYHPKAADTGTLEVKLDRVRHWLERGARPSAAVYQLLKRRHLGELGKTLTHTKPKPK